MGSARPVLLFAAWALATGSAAAAEGPSDYSSALGRVYWGYHQVLVQKEVCDASVPAARAANDRAFAAWQQRHRALAQELQQRVTAMIRNASRDQSDYVRNLGKYEGAILQERQEYRESLLKLGSDELRAQCQAMARVLGGAEADLAKVYAAELEVIRRRK